MITAKINVTKINKERLFKGKAGTYLDIVLIPHRQGRDQYGQDGFIAENTSKEERDSGNRGNIIGYFKNSDPPPQGNHRADQDGPAHADKANPPKTPTYLAPSKDDDVPF